MILLKIDPKMYLNINQDSKGEISERHITDENQRSIKNSFGVPENTAEI